MRSGYAFDWEFDLARAAVWNAGRTACTLTVEGYPEGDYGRRVELTYRFTAAQWRELMWLYDNNASQDSIEAYIDDALVMVRDLDPGEGLWAWSPAPVRSGGRKRAPSKGMPRCPSCGSETWAGDMKYNGVEDGRYFELYRCHRCGDRFSVTYDGPDDTGDWEVDDPDGWESPNRKAAKRAKAKRAPARSNVRKNSSRRIRR